MSNTSSVIVFSLSGFNETVNYRVTLFSLTLLSYCVILVVNVSIILTIILDENLHEPMYICLCNLCINELYGTAGFYPKFTSDLLSDIQVISYAGSLMSYDRYVAICRPLEYHSVMSLRRTVVLVTLSWFVPFCCETMVVMLTSTLKLCGSHIQKLYCENWSIVKLACSSTTANNIVGLILISFYCCHVLFILGSYVQLVKSAVKSRESRRKFTQTCVANFMAIEFLLIPPILNPVIYGLVLTKIRGRIISVCMKAGQKWKLRTNV
uniref:G-protein coupled receptors family 1 profile domain-containing protein n=1 Tax=Mastacembelus armatus TaxID=205130 RepID=A0A3Q3N1Z8_9TELE